MTTSLPTAESCSPASTARADAARALSVLLSHYGVDAHAQRLRESLAHDPSLEQIARELAQHGFDARPVEIAREDIPLLSTPTLMTLSDQRTVVLLSATRKGLRVLAADAEPVLLLPDDPGVFPAQALEISERVPDDALLLRRFWHVLRQRRRSLVRISLASLLVLAINLTTPALTREVLDRALPDNSRNLLLLVALALPVLALHRAWLQMLQASVVRQLESGVLTALLSGLMKHLVRLPFREQQRRPPHELVYALGSAEASAQLLVRMSLSPVLDTLSCVGYWLWLALLLKGVAFVACTASLLVVIMSGFTARKIALLTRASVTASARQNGFLYEVLFGLGTVKSMGVERACGRRWLERLIDERKLELDVADARLSLQTVQRLLVQGTRLLVLGWGAHACLQHELTLGACLAATMYTDGLMNASTRLGEALVQLWEGRVLVRSVDELLAIPAQGDEADLRAAPSSDEHAIVLSDVWFRYDEGRPWVVRGESMKVRRGHVAMLRGVSGEGKTTILRLIAGLYAPDNGQVMIEGRNPREVGHMLTYLPQQTHLFEGSLLQNLRLLSGASTERVLTAARQTGLDGWVGGLPMGFETLVSAGGCNVSGGQRQWIALTAALASDRPIMLLDEAMCHLDRPTREHLLQPEMFRGKTVVIVMHETDEASMRCVPN
jgi:ABC-type bacteriocin/lantibiotic exporter with double-glycine peptidase domain